MTVITKNPSASKADTAALPPASEPIELPEGMWDRIAQQAYALWETRGRRDGSALQDWLDAEQIVMDHIHEARQ